MLFRLAHRLLASKFLRQRDPSYFTDARDQSIGRAKAWSAALAETPSSAITRLIEGGYLVRCADLGEPELSAAFHSVCTVAEIRELLRARDLTLTGKKAELITRLAKNDPEAIRRMLKQRDLLQCSDAGRALAKDWAASVLALQDNIRQAIIRTMFDEAVQRKITFDEELGFPRWEFQGCPEATHLERIVSAAPSILGAVSVETLQKLRLNAAMWYVCGEYFTPPSGNVEESRLPMETAIRMILFSASWRRNIDQFRAAGISRVRHSAVMANTSTCDTCRQLHGREWLVGDAPELPSELCGNQELGCRCSYEPIWN
jgi:hypothetical protein